MVMVGNLRDDTEDRIPMKAVHFQEANADKEQQFQITNVNIDTLDHDLENVIASFIL